MRSQMLARTGLVALGLAGGLLVWTEFQPPVEAAVISDRVYLGGVARDFTQGHADFGLTGAAAPDTVAGLLETALGSDGLPVLADRGSVVVSHATDGDGVAVAPHWALDPAALSGSALRLMNPPTITDESRLDSYDPSAGPYGGSNVGPAPQVELAVAIDAETMPTGLGPPVGQILYQGGGTSTLADSKHCEKFLVRNEHTLRISGDVVLRVDEEFKVENEATIELLDGATLTVYVGKDCYIQDEARVNMNTWDHTRCMFYNFGDQPFTVQDESSACAMFYSSGADLFIKNESDFYGSVTSRNLYIDDEAALHAAGPGTATPTGCWTTGDTPANLGSDSFAFITDSSSFSQWFSNAPGVNAAVGRSIILDRVGDYYEFSTTDWDPIQGELYGNEPTADHNRYFTFQAMTDFEFSECSGQFIEVVTDAEVWVFIDAQLVIDLGGLEPGARQRFEVDRMGLTDGQTYELRFFAAQRHADKAALTVRTNLDLPGVRSIASVPAGDLHD